jgi:protein ImuA
VEPTTPASQPIAIAELRRTLERMGKPPSREVEALPFGVSEVDAPLPGGGFALGRLHEVIEGGPAGEYAGLAALFVAGILARHPGPVLWCLRGRDLFAPAPALARVGLHPDRVIYCETWKDAEVLPAMEEGGRCKGLAGVVGEVTHLSLNASRRLHLCAGETGVTTFAIRRWRNTTEKKLASEPNAATTRWRVSPSPSFADGFEGLLRQRWLVELVRCRGGEANSWILEACDAEGHLALPTAMAERPTAAGEQRRTAAG